MTTPASLHPFPGQRRQRSFRMVAAFVAALRVDGSAGDFHGEAGTQPSAADSRPAATASALLSEVWLATSKST